MSIFDVIKKPIQEATGVLKAIAKPISSAIDTAATSTYDALKGIVEPKDNSALGVIKNTQAGLPQAAANLVKGATNAVLPGIKPIVESVQQGSLAPEKQFLSNQLAQNTPLPTDTAAQKTAKTTNLVLGFTGGEEKNIIDNLAKETDVSKIVQVIKDKFSGIASDIIPSLSDKIAKETEPTVVNKLINTAVEDSKSVPSSSAASFDAEKYVQEQTAKAKEAAQTAKGGLGTKVSDFLALAKKKIVDSTAPIEDVLNDAMKQSGTKLPETEDIHNQIDRVLRAPTIAGQFAKDNGLVDVIKNTPNIDQLDQYLIAKHAIDLDTRGITTGRDLGKDTQLVKALGPTYEADAKVVNNYSKKMLQYGVDSGIISQSLSDALQKRYPNYVPFDRVFNELEEQRGQGGKSVASLSNQTFIRKIEGSEREVGSPIEGLLSRTNQLFKEGERNIAAKTLAGYEKLPGNPFELKETLNGEVPTDKGKISFFDNGVKRTFETTKDIAQAANSLNVEQLNTLEKILAFPVRVARVGITGINPAFLGANLARDQVTALINSDKSLTTSIANPSNFLQAITAAVGHGDLYDEMVRAGAGGTSYDVGRDQAEKTVQQIRASKTAGSTIKYLAKNPSQLLRAVEDIASRAEELTRVQQYAGTKAALLKEGQSEAEATVGAARAARDTTTNFARKGEWGNVLNSTFLYINAGIQSARNLLGNLAEKPVETSAKLAAFTLFPVAVATAWNLSDPKRKAAYDDISEYEKENNLIIIPDNPTKNADGVWNVIKLPLPQEALGLIGIARRPIEAVADSKPVQFGDFAKSLVGTLTPFNPSVGGVLSTVVPQAIEPSLQAGINKNIFTGSDEVPSYLKTKTPDKQVYPDTSGTARKIAALINVSPIKVQAFIKDTFGGSGTQALNAVDYMLSKAGVFPSSQVGGQGVLDAITARFSKAQGSRTAVKGAASAAASAKTKGTLPTLPSGTKLVLPKLPKGNSNLVLPKLK